MCHSLGGASIYSPRDEDKLTAWPVGSIPDLVDDKAGRSKRAGKLVAAAEP